MGAGRDREYAGERWRVGGAAIQEEEGGCGGGKDSEARQENSIWKRWTLAAGIRERQRDPPREKERRTERQQSSEVLGILKDILTL